MDDETLQPRHHAHLGMVQPQSILTCSLLHAGVKAMQCTAAKQQHSSSRLLNITYVSTHTTVGVVAGRKSHARPRGVGELLGSSPLVNSPRQPPLQSERSVVKLLVYQKNK
eukprot:TRINITY_DN8629_c0_g1_i1.p3 TRINITY_DN8629_c0_g1~~TRINITY_DN8629_c0_g1_i1.p3  ORF type:complete len:111 (-),score=3.43 TRINITY_DN8629_c0_g1_i1:81-413(-)